MGRSAGESSHCSTDTRPAALGQASGAHAWGERGHRTGFATLGPTAGAQAAGQVLLVPSQLRSAPGSIPGGAPISLGMQPPAFRLSLPFPGAQKQVGREGRQGR